MNRLCFTDIWSIGFWSADDIRYIGESRVWVNESLSYNKCEWILTWVSHANRANRDDVFTDVFADACFPVENINPILFRNFRFSDSDLNRSDFSGESAPIPNHTATEKMQPPDVPHRGVVSDSIHTYHQHKLPPCLCCSLLRLLFGVCAAFGMRKGDRARDLGIYGAAVGCVPFEPSLSAKKLDKDPVGRQAIPLLLPYQVVCRTKCCVKKMVNIYLVGYCVYRRSYLLWSPVILISAVLIRDGVDGVDSQTKVDEGFLASMINGRVR